LAWSLHSTYRIILRLLSCVVRKIWYLQKRVLSSLTLPQTLDIETFATAQRVVNSARLGASGRLVRRQLGVGACHESKNETRHSVHLLTGVRVDGQFITLTSVYSKVRIRQHVACVHLQQLITVVSRCAHISQSRDCIDRLPWSGECCFRKYLSVFC